MHKHRGEVSDRIQIRDRLKSGASLLMAAIWLWMAALSGSGELHAAFHPDADSPGHHCAVTELSHGNLDVALPVVSVVPPPSSPLDSPFPSSLPAPQGFDLRLDPGRAPPA